MIETTSPCNTIVFVRGFCRVIESISVLLVHYRGTKDLTVSCMSIDKDLWMSVLQVSVNLSVASSDTGRTIVREVVVETLMTVSVRRVGTGRVWSRNHYL